MQTDASTAVIAACRHLLLPLVRLLLRYGIGYREFAEISRQAYVDVASGDYGIRSRPANLSKVAVLTGISRKEVRRLRERVSGLPVDESRHGLSPPSLVLKGWYSDPDFQTSAGAPLALDIDGDAPSLTELVRRYAGDIPARAVVSEMDRMGMIVRLRSGKVQPAARNFMPPNDDGQRFASGAASIHRLIATIGHNTDPLRAGAPWFERYAWSSFVPAERHDTFRALVADRGLEFLELLDGWLRQHEAPAGPARDGRPPTEIGVGVYFFRSGATPMPQPRED